MQYWSPWKHRDHSTNLRCYTTCTLASPVLGESKKQFQTIEKSCKRMKRNFNVLTDKTTRSWIQNSIAGYLEHYGACYDGKNCEHCIIDWRYSCSIKCIKCLPNFHKQKKFRNLEELVTTFPTLFRYIRLRSTRITDQTIWSSKVTGNQYWLPSLKCKFQEI